MPQVTTTKRQIMLRLKESDRKLVEGLQKKWSTELHVDLTMNDTFEKMIRETASLHKIHH